MKMKRMLKKLLVTGMLSVSLLTLTAGSSVMTAYATEEEEDDSATDEERNQIRGQLNRYYSDLKLRYDISDENIKKMDTLYNSAMSYIAGADLDATELSSYMSSIEGYLDSIATQNTSNTEQFLRLSTITPINTAKYGEETFVVLSLINLGKTDIEDIVVTPQMGEDVNDRKTFPFDVDKVYGAQCVQIIQAADSVEEAYNKRMDIGWTFKVRDDVYTGCYAINFDVSYYMNGAKTSTTLTTYINITGANPKDSLSADDDEQKSNPRIIVTGFTTDPETVYAGDVFNLTVSVKNTSSETTVKNVLFNMEATVEGSTTVASYSAFLPTSGSSSVYTDSIAPGETYQMSIEMEAKADLSQKPYVLTLNMKYDTDDAINVEDSAEVSIPIKQEAKIDTGTAEIMPESIAVGEQSNVMFSVYNTGKTTLYNVKVTYESDAVESGITYIGNLDPGATGNVDSMVTGIAADDGSGVVTAVITYEDESGNETRYEKEITLSVYEEYIEEDFNFEDFTEYAEEESTGLPTWAIIVIVIAVVVVIVVIVVIILKKKKAKKHKEEMDLLDDDEDDL